MVSEKYPYYILCVIGVAARPTRYTLADESLTPLERCQGDWQANSVTKVAKVSLSGAIGHRHTKRVATCEDSKWLNRLARVNVRTCAKTLLLFYVVGAAYTKCL